MNIVKHLNNLNSQPLRKKSFTFWNKRYLSSIVLGSLLGTYLDLYFTAKQLYEFPVRVFPEVFSINIAFTLIGIPLFIMIFLNCISLVNKWGRAGMILFFSLLMSILEKLSEEFGWFVHSEEWEHLYTFLGYVLFLTMINFIFQWEQKRRQ